MTEDEAMIARAVARSATVAEVLAAPGVVTQAGALFRRQFDGTSACLLADERGWAAAGPAVEAALHAAGIATRRHILPATPRPKPTMDLADALQAVLAQDGSTPVAIGSGVMNDVVKHAAFALNRPYMVVATAASMDGYTSAGSPLSVKGFKKTIQCRPARAVLADLTIIAAAPPEMTGWGYGDLSGKVPAGGDWILADALGIEAIDDVAWPMVQGPLRRWLSHPERIAAGEPAAIEGLFAGLTLVGLAMEAHGSSRPASGADHQIAHLWEMEDLHHMGQRVSHGACVAVGCVATLDLYDWLLAQDLTRLNPTAIVAQAPDMACKARGIADAFGHGEIAERALAETEAKHAEGAVLHDRMSRLAATWPALRARMKAHLLPADDMRRALLAAGAPVEPEDIGVDRGHLRLTVLKARFLRSRFTVLDLLDETGLLMAAVDAVFPLPASQARAV